MNNEAKLSRRLFTATLAGSSGLTAQQQPAPQQPEPLRFAEPLTFTRRDAELRATPYPVSQVRLLAGPCLKGCQFQLRLPHADHTGLSAAHV